MADSGSALFKTIPLNGPLFVGTIINWLLLGVQLHQVYDYSRHYQQDKGIIKLLVYGLLSLDIAQTGLSTRFSWLFLVQDWGDYSIFSKPSWTGPTMPVMAGAVAFVVQSYYAWRILSLGGRKMKFYASFIGLLSTTQFIAAFVSSIKFELQGSSMVNDSLVPGFTIWLVSSFLCDCVIAGCMLNFCRRAKIRASFKATSTILNQVIRNVVETAAVTAFCAGGQLVCFLAFRNSSLAYLAPAYLLGKLYSNCLMANLNGRRMLRPSEDGHSGVHGVLRSSDVLHLKDGALPQTTRSPSPMTGLLVQEIRDVQLDYTSKGDSEENVCA